MTRNKLLSDISVSTVQAILNQLSGIVVFIIISKCLDKPALGYINWVFAVLTVVFSVLGFGLEHVAVRKAATGKDPGLLLQSYLFHVMLTGGVFLLLLIMVQHFLPGTEANRKLFLLLSVSQCFSFFSQPFRQIINGLEKFRSLLVMSSIGNLIKVAGLVVLVIMRQVSVSFIIYTYLAASLIELIVCVSLYTIKLKLPFVIGFNISRYVLFINEAMPQLGVTVFNTAVQRMDWILLGFLSTSVMVAEYSVTNRLFELTQLPLLIIAPIIFPKIAKLFNAGVAPGWKMEQLKMLVRFELIVAVFVALITNICWKEMVDAVTDHKYGDSTQPIIFIMSFAMPLIYLNNIFWSILFAQERMRALVFIFLGTFAVNLAADLLLIPFYHAKGAALGFVIALFSQTCFYYYRLTVVEIKRMAFHLFPVMIIAFAAGFLSYCFFDFFIWRALAASGIYFLLLAFVRQLKQGDLFIMKKMVWG